MAGDGDGGEVCVEGGGRWGEGGGLGVVWYCIAKRTYLDIPNRLNTWWTVSSLCDDDELMLNVLRCHLTY